ncbi:hypothetical protein [Streptomyces reniochalinae]|uniref:hypothetical protein n=1 Tax=Streptomyces reniochalinae TaxID=2250578 RepID=UPI0011C01FFE|nr:hypothetical protein [Streptomyces reniochalinae]
MDARLPSRRELLSVAALAGATALTGCSTHGSDRSNGRGKGKPSPTPSTTDLARLDDGLPLDPAASARSGSGAWRYTHLADTFDGSYQALAVTSRDDVWAFGVRGGVKDGQGPDALFLDHWDGDRWRSHPLPDGLAPKAASWALAASGPDDVWLASRPSRSAPSAHHWDGHTWRTLPAPPAVKSEVSGGDELYGSWFAAVGPRLWLCVDGKTLHWDGDAWQVPELPFHASAITAARAEDPKATLRVWVVGSVDTDCGSGECYPQPASARWAHDGWQKLDTPAYRFPDPVPPEASASLATVVHDPERDRLWSLGRNDFNHGEVEEEPDSETILLTGDGSGWTKRRLPRMNRAVSTATTVPDGTGSLLLDSQNRLTKDGKVRRLDSPGRLPDPPEYASAPPEKYDFGQPMECSVLCLVPGTRTVLAAGAVRYIPPGTNEQPLRPMLARYDAGGQD